MIKRNYFISCLFILILGNAITSQALYGQDRVQIHFTGENHSSSSIRARFYKDIDYVPVRELADLLRAETYFNNFNKKIVLKLGNHKVTVTALNPFVKVDNTTLQLPISTFYDDRGIWVPLDYFIDMVASYLPTPIAYDRETHTLFMENEGINILAVNLEEKRNGTLIRVPTARRFELSNLSRRLSQGWLYIDIYGGKIDSTRLVKTRPSGIIRKMIPHQFEEAVQLSFHLKKQIKLEDVLISSNDREILVSLRTSTKIPQDMIVDLEQERKKWIIDKIILDPGHGGWEPGAVQNGLKEKDVVLSIAKELKKLIERKLDVKVLMTRDRDEYVELRKRSEFANRNGGKLFISIHANSFNDSRTRGVETCVFGVAKTEKDRELAFKENSVIKYEESWESMYGNLDDENYILMAMAQNSFNKESHELAGFVQNELYKNLRAKNRGYRQGDYIVLNGTSMPKILVEVGFLSNRNEAKKLKTRSYRKKVAETIFAGIKKFKEHSEKNIIEGLIGNHPY